MQLSGAALYSCGICSGALDRKVVARFEARTDAGWSGCIYGVIVVFTLGAEVRYEGEPTKGSRFIATIQPAANEEQAKRILAAVASEMPDATHHCWAWRLASPMIERCGDDGEPSGSAGRPILAQLSGRQLVNTAAIVSRYYGGSKLGVGGLVRAYGGAVGEALDQVELMPWLAQTELVIEHSHSDADAVVRCISDAGGFDVSVDYGASVVRTVQIAVESLSIFRELLSDATAGRIDLVPVDSDHLD